MGCGHPAEERLRWLAGKVRQRDSGGQRKAVPQAERRCFLLEPPNWHPILREQTRVLLEGS